MESIESGLAAGLIVILYGLTDKVLIPLITKGRRNANGRSSAQTVINDDHARRIGGIETELSGLRDTIAETRTAVALSEAALRRIEELSRRE